jgi:MoxR-like ATPase
MEINHRIFRNVLQRCYETKVPIDVKGKTGIGKSWVIKEQAQEIAKQKKKKFCEWNELSSEEKRGLLTNFKDIFLFVDIRLSQLDPTDLKGLINFQDDFVEWKPQLLWKILSMPGADGIVFFDEANLAPPSVLAACYQIINDRQCGENPISKDVLFVSAGNSLSDKAHVFDEPAPLKNRRLNYVLADPFMDATAEEDWGKWAADNGIIPSIISFLYFKPCSLAT